MANQRLFTAHARRRLPLEAGALLAIALLTASPAFAAGEHVFGANANLVGRVERAGSVAAPAAQPAAAQPAAGVAGSAPAKPAYLQEDQPLKLKDYEEPHPAAPEPWWSQLFGFLFKLALVIGLVIGTLAAVKKFNGGRVILPNTKGRTMVVLESAHLGAQQAIHLVSLGGERLLVVGTGPEGPRTLSEIGDPAQVRPLLQAQKSTPSASAFNQVFDLQSVVSDTNSELLDETLREFGDPPRGSRGEWPRA